jgi:hypothetical protein
MNFLGGFAAGWERVVAVLCGVGFAFGLAVWPGFVAG